MFEATEPGQWKYSISPDSVQSLALYQMMRKQIVDYAPADGGSRPLSDFMPIYNNALESLLGIVSDLEARIIELESKLEN